MTEPVQTIRTRQPGFEHDARRLDKAARDLGLRLVLVYGSRARGTAGASSDLDVAVIGCPASAWMDCYRSLAQVFADQSLDLVRLESADALFRHEIMRDAVRLYGDPDLFSEYRSFAYRDFVDSADLFALEETLSQRKLARIKEQLHGPS